MVATTRDQTVAVAFQPQPVTVGRPSPLKHKQPDASFAKRGGRAFGGDRSVRVRKWHQRRANENLLHAIIKHGQMPMRRAFHFTPLAPVGVIV